MQIYHASYSHIAVFAGQINWKSNFSLRPGQQWQQALVMMEEARSKKRHVDDLGFARNVASWEIPELNICVYNVCIYIYV